MIRPGGGAPERFSDAGDPPTITWITSCTIPTFGSFFFDQHPTHQPAGSRRRRTGPALVRVLMEGSGHDRSRSTRRGSTQALGPDRIAHCRRGAEGCDKVSQPASGEVCWAAAPVRLSAYHRVLVMGLLRWSGRVSNGHSFGPELVGLFLASGGMASQLPA